MQLLASKDCTRWVVWIVKQQIIVLALHFLVSFFKVYQKVVRVDIIVFVSCKFRLRNIGYPRWVRKNEISIENVLETVDKLFGAWTDNHLKWINGCLGVLLVPLGNGFPESWETLDM